MANVWPPVPTPSGDFSIYTNSTVIVWGTDGMLQGYIVVSASETQRVEVIPIENGSGFEATLALLNKGLDVEFEVVEDPSITPPAFGQVVTLSSPYGASRNILCVENKSTQARKREGMRTITFRSYNAITGLN